MKDMSISDIAKELGITKEEVMKMKISDVDKKLGVSVRVISME